MELDYRAGGYSMPSTSWACEDTLVIWMSENGPGGGAGLVLVLGLLARPLFYRAGRFPAHAVSGALARPDSRGQNPDAIVHITDVMPTLADVGGLTCLRTV